jgi:uncharacterized protein (DUF1015 family)
MTEIAPFRGVRYNKDKIPDLSKVVIPPYDVISREEQEVFYSTNPHNMINLELGKAYPEDTDDNNPHTRAGRFFKEWRKDDVLIRDDLPAVYYYELQYSLAPQLRQTRRGFICALKLADFSTGSVRPHEKTFQAVKDERLRLMLASGANFSPVFALYSDPSNLVDHTLRSGKEEGPIFSFSDKQGMDHTIWRVNDVAVLRQTRALMEDKAIFIADGHHRYETALNYRNMMRGRHEDAGSRAPFEYIMMYLSNLNHGGLTILPTHRLLKHLGEWDSNAFLENAKNFFSVSSFRASGGGEAEWRAGLESGSARKETTIGLHWKGSDSFYLMEAKREPVSAFLGVKSIHGLLHDLDVEVLDQVILRHLFSLSESALSNENNIHFNHDLTDALSLVKSGMYEAGFFINPTRIEQVQDVASAGLIMPHKSTYFYPKVGSGLVINPLMQNEEMLW